MLIWVLLFVVAQVLDSSPVLVDKHGRELGLLIAEAADSAFRDRFHRKTFILEQAWNIASLTQAQAAPFPALPAHILLSAQLLVIEYIRWLCVHEYVPFRAPVGPTNLASNEHTPDHITTW